MRPIKYRAYFSKIQTMIYQEDFTRFELLEDGHVAISAKYGFEKGGWYRSTRGATNKKTVVPGTTKQVPSLIVLEYTGLKDKNGTEIYEGDKVFDHYYDAYGTVSYDEGMYLYDRLGVASPLGECHMDLEVIGNIYENSDLSEVE